jgi:hypothetical protein
MNIAVMELGKDIIIRKSCKIPLNAFQLVGTSRRNIIMNKDGNFYLWLKKRNTNGESCKGGDCKNLQIRPKT